MRSRFRSKSGPNATREGGPVELVRVRGAQRDTGDAGYRVEARSRRRGGRGRRRGGRNAPPPPPPKPTFLGWLKSLFGPPKAPPRAERRPDRGTSLDQQEAHVLAEFAK